MDSVKILSLSTGKILNKKVQKYKKQEIFTVNSFPYALNVSAGATIFFEPNCPEFDLRFDIFDAEGKELDEEVHEFDPDFERIVTTESGIIVFEIWMTPKQHIAKSPGMYTIKATILHSDGEVLDELSTRFYLIKSVDESV